MNELDSRRLWLIRAFEAPITPPWSEADAVWATDEARRELGSQASLTEWAGRRAQLAVDRLASRSVGLREAVVRLLEPTSQGAGWVAGAGLVAFGAGLWIDSVGHQGRVNLLSLPLIGLLAWTLLVYAALLLWPLARQAAFASGGRSWASSIAARALQQLAQTRQDLERTRLDPPAHGPSAGSGPAEALTRFAASWAMLTRPAWQARAVAMLHLAAAGLAAGAIAGLYVRGLALEYRASWDSTFLSANQALQVLRALLGPASAITGLPLPSPPAFEALRGSAGGGENAARWIHLWSVTLAAAVIVPRLALAWASLRRARIASRDVSLPWSEDGWLRQLVARHRTGAVQLRVLPYRTQAEGSARDRIRALLTRSMGSEPVIRWEAPVAEGQDGHDLLANGGEATVLLVSARQTPERETHGRLLRELQAAGSGRQPAMPLLLLVDTTAFGERLSRADAASRLRERRLAWAELARDADLEPIFVELGGDMLAGPREVSVHDAIARCLMADPSRTG